MVISVLVIKALRDVISMRGQLLAIVLLVAAGCATFIMMRSMHASLVSSLEDYYRTRRYPDLFVDVKQAPTNVLDKIQELPGVRDTEARIRQRVSIDIPGLDEVASADVISLPAGPTSLSSLHLVSGRLPDASDGDEVVVYAPFAESNDLAIGDSITVLLNGMRTRLRIAATAISPEFLIIMSPGTMMLDSRRNGVLWIRNDVLASRYNMIGAWNSALVQVRKRSDLLYVKRAIDDIVARFGAYGVSVRSDQLSHRFITDEIRQNEVSALIIPSIIYGVAIFLLNVSINRLVTTQRSIIAILRAFGYTQGAIAAHYVAIAMLIVILGTGLGIAIGYIGGIRLAGWYMEFYRFPRLLFAIPIGVSAWAFGLAVVSALTGAISAVRSVILLQPADAMRPAAPKQFRPGPVTKLTTRSNLHAMTRLMLQNIDRRLGRSLLIVIMVALATSIIVLSRYMNDAMDTMMSVEFDRALLADATVTFSRAVPYAAAKELEHIPGIREAEPFRMYPVDVLGTGSVYRTTLAARSPNSRMIRVTNQYGRIEPLPENGVVMTAFLADSLRLRVGDTFRMKILEGASDTITTTLSGTTHEALGSQCYATPAVLQHLRREEPLANGAWIDVEPGAATRVQSILKERPAVIGVLFRNVAIDSFTDVYGTNVLVVASYLLVLACLVSVGVLYNNARILIAERSAELASLRIQGFTVAEITKLVLGEQGVITVVALPLGLVLGTYASYLVTASVEADVIRLPFVISRYTLLVTSAVILIIWLAVAYRIYLMLRSLDLIAVLKERT